MKSPMNAETYRRKAEQYLTFAHQVREPNAKAALIDVAAHWMQMAKQSEGQNEGLDRQQRVDANSAFAGR
jgi:hypothetical protein